MLTIARRRSISTRTLFDPAFREQLEGDPRAALLEAFGIDPPPSEVVQLLMESATR